jgi:type IV fimbrial biogenesis protein FimT
MRRWRNKKFAWVSRVGHLARTHDHATGHPAVTFRLPAGPAAHRRGFTLVELMVVVALVAIAASVATPSLRGMLVRNRTAAASNEFVASVLRARSEAVSRNTCVTVCRSALETTPPRCDAGTDWRIGWIAFVNASCDAAATAPQGDNIFLRSGALDPLFSLVSTATNGNALMFSASGNAQAGDAGRFDLKYGTQAQSSDRGICLNALGHVRLVAAGGTC